MPLLDRTGPAGRGPMTGRGLGACTPLGAINHVAIDRFTLVHFAAGWLAGKRFPLWQVALAAVGFELLEDPLKTRYPGMFPHPSHDTKQNALVDVGAVCLGALLRAESN